MDMDYTGIRNLIQTLKLSGNETFDVIFEVDQTNKRMLSIVALIKSEVTFLQMMTKLLTDTFNCFEKEVSFIFRSHIVTKEQVKDLICCIPSIYTMHAGLNKAIKEEMLSSKLVGKVLFDFLCQKELLETYEKYAARIPNSLSICKMIETKAEIRHESLHDLKELIGYPLQTFLRLNAAITDIYITTPHTDTDKVSLFKAMSITRSIMERMETQQRKYEYKDFNDISNTLSRLRLPFSSTKLLSNYSVFELITNFPSTGNVIKTPYFMMLGNQNVVMLPRDIPLCELSTEVAFSYSIKEIEFEQHVLSKIDKLSTRFGKLSVNDPMVCCDKFTEVKNLYLAINGSNVIDPIIRTYGDLLNDYCILTTVLEDMKQLHFQYKEIDQLEIKRSMIELEGALEDKERDLNVQMSSITILNSSVTKKIILFESTRHANEWRMNFNRTKLLSNIQLDSDWLYYPSGKDFQRLDINELPFLFQPFTVKTDIIENLKSVILKCQAVYVVIGTTARRCLWIYLSSGWCILLHFCYNHWRLVESFQMEKNQTINAVCNFTDFTGQVTDSEMWIASDYQIFIHSLVNNRFPDLKTRLTLKSEIRSLCNIGDKMLVGLKSNVIIVYAKIRGSFWIQEREFSLETLHKCCEEMKEILYGNSMVYVIYDTEIIICEKNETGFLTRSRYESTDKITASSITFDGLWISFENQSVIILYDKYLGDILHTISLSSQILSSQVVGTITSIYTDDKYMWIGTEIGFIMCISTIDSSYCTDSNQPIYVSPRFASGAITQFIPFHSIQSTNIRNDNEKKIDQKLNSVQKKGNLSASATNADLFEELSDGANKNWTNCSWTLIIALGTGIVKYVEKTDFEIMDTDASSIFTFFE